MKQFFLVFFLFTGIFLLALGCRSQDEKPSAVTPKRPPSVAEDEKFPEISDERKSHVGKMIQESATGGTQPPAPGTEPAGGPTATETELQSLVHAGKLGFDLYQHLKKTPGNLVFSPASVSVTLAMAMGGAKGPTATELAQALGVDTQQTERTHRLFGEALRIWNATDRLTLKVASRVFVEATVNPVPGFTTLTRDFYMAPASPMDFIQDSEGSRGQINQWISQNTENRIPALLAPGSLNHLTRLVLANAVYFKGTWLNRFSPEQTRPREFFSTAREVRKVSTMHMTSRLAWARHPDGLFILETPYVNENLTMIWLLPEKRHQLAGLEKKLSVAALERWRKATRMVDVRVQLPRFKLEPPPMNLEGVLQLLGIRQAFSPLADFSNMAKLPDGLFISHVFHQAFIEVNEEGAEAAATTAVVMPTMSADRPPPPEPASFIADHPFLFVLMDLRTRMPLFVGRVTHP